MVGSQAPDMFSITLPTPYEVYIYMGVSENRGAPKSSILIGISIINHPFWGTTIFGNTHIPPPPERKAL